MVPCSGGKIGPTRWASPVHPKLGSGWTIKLLAQKKLSQIWPDLIWPRTVGPARPDLPTFFLPLKGYLARPARFLGRAGLLKCWPEKSEPILAKPDFGLAHCWSGPARPAPLDCQLSFHGLPNTTSIQNSNIHLHCHCGEPELVHCTNYKPFYEIFEITNLLHF